LLGAGAGDILLTHDGGGNRAQTVVALQSVLPQLRHAGLRFVVLWITLINLRGATTTAAVHGVQRRRVGSR
jgi:hypothetical protein